MRKIQQSRYYQINARQINGNWQKSRGQDGKREQIRIQSK
jgi:hypothetical protein